MNNSYENGMHSASSGNVLTPDVARQTDYVQLLRNRNEPAEALYVKVCGNRRIEVLVPFKGLRCAHYGFGKNQHDDFILFRDGAISELESSAGPDGADGLSAVKRFDVLQPWSNKEYALCVSPAESDFKPQWLPEHNRTGTVFAVSQRLFIDEAEIDEWTQEQTMRKAQTVRIEQRMLGIHPDDPSSPIAEIDCTHVVDRGGVSVHSVIRWLRPVTIRVGYGMMFPVTGSFAGLLATGLGNTYEATATDASRTDLLDDDRSVSYAFLPRPDESGEAADVVAAMTVRDIAATFRYGQEGRRAGRPVVWIEHRNATIQKLYPQVFEQYTAKPGETYEASGTYFIGEWPADERSRML